MAYYTSPNILAQNFGLLLFSLATEEPFQKAFITVSGETEKKIASNFFPKPSQDRVILTSQPAGTDVACALNTSDHSKIRQNKKKVVPKVVMIKMMHDERRTINNKTITSLRQPRNMVAISQQALRSQQSHRDPSQKNMTSEKWWNRVAAKLYMLKHP